MSEFKGIIDKVKDGIGLNELIYREPRLYKDNEIGFEGMVLQFSSLGTVAVGSVGMRFNQIEELISPVLKGNGISYDEYSFTVVNADVGRNLLSYDLSSEDKVNNAVKAIILHYNKYAKPFFQNYRNLNQLLELLNETEAIPKGGYFQGAEGVFRRLALSMLTNDSNFEDRKLKYSKVIDDLCIQSSSFKIYKKAYVQFASQSI